MKIGFVGCGAAKLAVPARARDLYTGTLFKLARRYAERHCSRFYILSAKYGLLEPDRIIAPYDVALSTMSRAAREQWAVGALAQVRAVTIEGATLVLLAGSLYGAGLPPEREDPMFGLSLGWRMRWLKEHT